MGNIQNSEQQNRNDDEYNYNIDAEVVRREDMSTVPNIVTPLDIKSNKMFIVYQRVNGISKTFVLNIKIIDDNIFVYVTDILHEKTILSHVSKIFINGKKKTEYYLKYIQISRDFKLISLPENDRVNIYDLTKLLNRNILEYVDNIGIVLRADKNGHIRSTIEIFDSISDTNKKSLSDMNKDKIANINYNYVECGFQSPYKCILCQDLYIVICVDFNRYKKVIAVDHKNKRIHMVNNLDLDVNRSALKFSTNGHFMAIYDGSKNKLFVCDMTENNPTPKKLDLVIENNTVLDTVSISDDGRFFFYIQDTDMKIRIYDVYFEKIYILDSGLDVDKKNITDIKFHLMDYSRFSDIALTGNDCDSLYVLVGWDKKLSSAFYWMLRCSDKNYVIYGPSFIDMKIEEPIEYVYNNGYMFIYKTTSGITAFDLNKVIPIRFAGMLAQSSKKTLDELFKNHYRDHQYYDSITLKGADESDMTYPVSETMGFFLSLIKPTDKNDGIDTNIFQLRVTANIDIYGTTKSFQIYQDLLTGKINHSEIIEKIFAVQGMAGRHNMMSDLMTHMYEYTRVIALKETANGDFDRTGFSGIKSLYIGYQLIVLVLKYYSMLFRSLTGLPMNGKLSISQNISYQGNIERYDIFDIVLSFNENFPAFKEFINHSIELLMGERLI